MQTTHTLRPAVVMNVRKQLALSHCVSHSANVVERLHAPSPTQRYVAHGLALCKCGSQYTFACGVKSCDLLLSRVMLAVTSSQKPSLSKLGSSCRLPLAQYAVQWRCSIQLHISVISVSQALVRVSSPRIPSILSVHDAARLRLQSQYERNVKLMIQYASAMLLAKGCFRNPSRCLVAQDAGFLESIGQCSSSSGAPQGPL